MSPNVPARERLLTALATVIARNGFNGTKIQDVAREAKVSLRTFYLEFDSKEACFLVLHEELTRNMEAPIIAAINAKSTWPERMLAGFESYLTLLAVFPQMTYAALVELATLSDEARLARQAAVQRFAQLLVDQVEIDRAANADIPSRPLTLALARGITGAVTELTMDMVVRNQAERLPEIAPIAAELLWSVVVNQNPFPIAGTPADANTPKSGIEPLGAGA